MAEQLAKAATSAAQNALAEAMQPEAGKRLLKVGSQNDEEFFMFFALQVARNMFNNRPIQLLQSCCRQEPGSKTDAPTLDRALVQLQGVGGCFIMNPILCRAPHHRMSYREQFWYLITTYLASCSQVSIGGASQSAANEAEVAQFASKSVEEVLEPLAFWMFFFCVFDVFFFGLDVVQQAHSMC